MPDASGPEYRPFEGFWSVTIHEFCAVERQANAPRAAESAAPPHGAYDAIYD